MLPFTKGVKHKQSEELVTLQAGEDHSYRHRGKVMPWAMSVAKVAMHVQEEFVRKQATMRIKMVERANSDLQLAMGAKQGWI